MSKLVVLPKGFDVLDANDRDCTFRINIDVLNAGFGLRKDAYFKAVYPQSKYEYISGSKPGQKFVIWMPKLYGNSSEWANRVSDDGNTIYEVAEPTRHIDWIQEDKHPMDVIRLVFVKPDPKRPYRFAGAFVNGKMDHLNHTYRRIATKVRVIGDPVRRVELLDRIDYNDNSVSHSDVIKHKLEKKVVEPPKMSDDECKTRFPIGSKVRHSKFGVGTVKDIKDGKIYIRFDSDIMIRTLDYDFCVKNNLLERVG